MGLANWFKSLDRDNRAVDNPTDYSTVSPMSRLGELCSILRSTGTFPTYLSSAASGPLNRGFTWGTTPQGHEYWQDIRRGVQPLTEEDRDWILGLGKYYGIQ